MIGRIAWIAGLVALGLVTTFAQIDRSSRFQPALAQVVPQPFRGFAQARLAQQAIASEQPGAAVELARRLVRVRPLPAENLTLLSQAWLQDDDVDQGLAALEVAGKRGWREPISQLAMAQAALLAGAPDAASLRVAALLATGAVERSTVDPLIVGIAASPEGREALAHRLAEAGYWQNSFVAQAAGTLEPAAYVDVIARAQAINAVIDCSSLERGVSALRNAGQGDLVEPIWPGNCPEG